MATPELPVTAVTSATPVEGPLIVTVFIESPPTISPRSIVAEYEPAATLNMTGPFIPHAPRNCIALSIEVKFVAPVPAGSIVYVPLS